MPSPCFLAAIMKVFQGLRLHMMSTLYGISLEAPFPGDAIVNIIAFGSQYFKRSATNNSTRSQGDPLRALIRFCFCICICIRICCFSVLPDC